MPTLILVRHGQASFGAADYDQLSELGARQAGLAAEELRARGVTPTVLVAGSLRRQRGTAAPIETATGLEASTDERWNEYRSDDLLAAHSSTDLRLGGGAAPVSSRQFQDVLEDGLRAWAAAGGDSAADESWPAFRARVDAVVRDTGTALGSGQTAAAVTSGGVISAACATLLGGDVETFVALNRVVVNAAATTIVSGRSGQTLLSFNDHAHLLRGEGLVTFR